MSRIVLSGVTSYTGMCIAEALVARGHHVTGLARGELEHYSGARRARLLRASEAGAHLVGGLPAEGDAMAQWVKDREIDIWIHHHHPMERFRALDYDVVSAQLAATVPLPRLIRNLREAGARAVVYSGTYFEPGEGGQSPSARPTPYAQLKHELSANLVGLCSEHQLRFAKVVIPAPTGALENDDRLTPQLIRAAERRVPFEMRSPDSVMDVIPGETLAQVYADAVEQCNSHRDARLSALVFRPSGGVFTVAEWVERVRTGILRPLGLEDALAVEIPQASKRPTPVACVNPESERIAVDWGEVGERYARDWRSSYALRVDQS